MDLDPRTNEPLPPGMVPNFPPNYPFKWQQKIMPQPHPNHLRSLGLPTAFSYNQTKNYKIKNPGYGGYYHNNEYDPRDMEDQKEENFDEERYQTDDNGMLLNPGDREDCEENYNESNQEYDEYATNTENYDESYSHDMNQHHWNEGNRRSSQHNEHSRNNDPEMLPSYLKDSDEFGAFDDSTDDWVDEEEQWKMAHQHVAPAPSDREHYYHLTASNAGSAVASSNTEEYDARHRKQTWLRHQKRKYGDRFCSTCEEGFYSASQFERHLTEHVTCPYCGYQGSVDSLSAHVTKEHLTLKDNINVEDYIAKRKARYCTVQRRELAEAVQRQRRDRGELMGMAAKYGRDSHNAKYGSSSQHRDNAKYGNRYDQRRNDQFGDGDQRRDNPNAKCGNNDQRRDTIGDGDQRRDTRNDDGDTEKRHDHDRTRKETDEADCKRIDNSLEQQNDCVGEISNSELMTLSTSSSKGDGNNIPHLDPSKDPTKVDSKDIEYLNPTSGHHYRGRNSNNNRHQSNGNRRNNKRNAANNDSHIGSNKRIKLQNSTRREYVDPFAHVTCLAAIPPFMGIAAYREESELATTLSKTENSKTVFQAQCDHDSDEENATKTFDISDDEYEFENVLQVQDDGHKFDEQNSSKMLDISKFELPKKNDDKEGKSSSISLVTENNISGSLNENIEKPSEAKPPIMVSSAMSLLMGGYGTDSDEGVSDGESMQHDGNNVQRSKDQNVSSQDCNGGKLDISSNIEMGTNVSKTASTVIPNTNIPNTTAVPPNPTIPNTDPDRSLPTTSNALDAPVDDSCSDLEMETEQHDQSDQNVAALGGPLKKKRRRGSRPRKKHNKKINSQENMQSQDNSSENSKIIDSQGNRQLNDNDSSLLKSENNLCRTKEKIEHPSSSTAIEPPPKSKSVIYVGGFAPHLKPINKKNPNTSFFDDDIPDVQLNTALMKISLLPKSSNNNSTLNNDSGNLDTSSHNNLDTESCSSNVAEMCNPYLQQEKQMLARAMRRKAYQFKQNYKESLLAKILSSEVQRERNVLLQCARSVVHNDFYEQGKASGVDGADGTVAELKSLVGTT